MKFKVTKEELIRLMRALEIGDIITDKDRTLEGEAVEEHKIKSNGGCNSCDAQPKPIEEIMFAFDAKKDFDAIMILKDKLNELVRAFNITNNTK